MNIPNANDGKCLRYPDPLPLHPAELPPDQAAHILLDLMHRATTTPFHWSYIDKPADGSLILLYLPPGPNTQFPIDGVRYGEHETRYNAPVVVKGQQVEIEVGEIKYGFAPQSMDQMASRVRRRFRFARAGNPQLTLVHYSRGPAMPVAPAMHQPMRQYPLQAIQAPAVYVAGDRMGQRIPLPGMAPMPQQVPQTGMPGMMPGAPGPFNMLHSQNASMAELEQRRREQAKLRAMQQGGVARQQPGAGRPDDDHDDDDIISVQNLAMARYRRNHEWMNHVFSHAAHGEVNAPPKEPDFGVFDLKELEEKKEKLEKEIEELKSKPSHRRQAAKQLNDDADVSMMSATES
ncbi:hypothetical protein DL96DRAFT_1610197 [Flagelloscypha sp. PMI_526]|nr:hypothetical protein DL96DRAFT_1610197 [Flagelloscypha sp. PMI_526]